MDNLKNDGLGGLFIEVGVGVGDLPTSWVFNWAVGALRLMLQHLFLHS